MKKINVLLILFNFVLYMIIFNFRTLSNIAIPITILIVAESLFNIVSIIKVKKNSYLFDVVLSSLFFCSSRFAARSGNLTLNLIVIVFSCIAVLITLYYYRKNPSVL